MRKKTSKSKIKQRIARKKGDVFLRAMLPTISGDRLWRVEYEQFVESVSYATSDAALSFNRAIETYQLLVAQFLGGLRDKNIEQV